MTKQIIASGGYSLLLHIALAALLIVGMESQPALLTTPSKVDIVQATSVDEKQVLEQMMRLQDIEDKKKEQEKARQKKVEQQLKQTQQELAQKKQEFIDQQKKSKNTAKKARTSS